MTRLPFALLLVVSLGACASSTGPALPKNVPETLELTLPNLDGQDVKLTDLRGKVVLVDMWATWCKPCEESFPFYGKLYERRKGEGFEILAVSVDEDDDDVRAFLEQKPVPFTVLRDPKGTIPAQLDIQTMPTAFLVDRQGRIAFVHAGFVPADEEEIEAEVARALGRGEP